MSKTSPPCIETATIRAHLACEAAFTEKVAPLNLTSSDQVVASTAPPADVRIRSLTRNVIGSLDDAKAEDVLVIDLEGKTSIADAMVIATGRSNTHVNSIADRVLKTCKDHGFATRVEGMPQCDWVLIDAGDMVVHIFRPEVRQFYNLEKMWGTDRPDERRAG